jgi:hypothetical protein
MRILILSFLFICATFSTIAQTAEFNNTFKLQDGIYTSYVELITNNPTFPNCILITNNNQQDVNIYTLKYSKIDESYEKDYNSTLFATVLNGKLSIYYQKKLIPVYLKGTLCRFIYTRFVSTGSSSNNTQNSELLKSDICLLDIQTGEIYKLTKENLGRSIKRDASLYATYTKIKPGKKNKIYLNTSLISIQEIQRM